MAYKVFLSHSSVDAKWERWIAANAQQVGIEVYLYEHDPQPGRLVADKIEAEISLVTRWLFCLRAIASRRLTFSRKSDMRRL